VTLLTTGKEGTVIKRTTTDILVETRDGKKAWVEVEKVGQDRVAAIDARKGEQVYLRDDGTPAVIVQKTTTDALLRLPDGKEKWYAIEDIRQDCMAAVDARVGERATVRDNGTSVIILKKTTTDALVRLPDGKEQWMAIEDLTQDIKPASEVRVGEEVKVRGKEEWGTVVEMTSTDVCVQLASNGTKMWLGMEDITNNFVAASDVAVGDAVVLRGSKQPATVMERTTTDVLLQTPQGQEWHAIEDIEPDATVGVEVKVGEQATVRGGNERGKVLQRTTTDILLSTPQGEKWYPVEDIVGKDSIPDEPSIKAPGIFACCMASPREFSEQTFP